MPRQAQRARDYDEDEEDEQQEVDQDEGDEGAQEEPEEEEEEPRSRNKSRGVATEAEEEEGEEEEPEQDEAQGGEEDEPTSAKQLSPAQLQEIAELISSSLVAHMSNKYNDDPDTHVGPQHVHREVVDDEVDPDNTDNLLIKLTLADNIGSPHSIDAKMDTGADDNIIKLDVAEHLGLDIAETEGPEPYTTGSGEDVSPIGIATISYRLNGKPYTQDFRVMEQALPYDIILGGPFLLQSHLVSLNLPKQKKQKGIFVFALGGKKSSPAELEAFRQQRAAERAAAAKAHALSKGVR